jgi:phosphohistidine phosphatase
VLLYIIRHAWAGQAGDPRWPDDADRPLTDEGRQRYALVVQKLASAGFAPTIIATSPLTRCRQTAEVISQCLSAHPEIVDLEELSPGSDLRGLLKWTTRQAENHQEIAWVGHAPDVGRMVAELIGNGSSAVDFSKGAVAAIRFDDRLKAGEGELRWLASPKILGC